MTKTKLRQIRISNELYVQLKNYTKTHQITLSEFYSKVFQWFFSWQSEQKAIQYQAGYQNGKCLSLWLDDPMVERIHALAQQANVADARVIYTALMLYLENNLRFNG